MQAATGESVEIAYVDQGYTGGMPAEVAAAHSIQLVVIKHPEARRGFVLLPWRWGGGGPSPGPPAAAASLAPVSVSQTSSPASLSSPSLARW